MRHATTSFPGVATTNPNYSAKHSIGVALIPLGDRDRVKSTQIYLVGSAEEMDSVDRVFSKQFRG